jgi:hypothetical protein
VSVTTESWSVDKGRIATTPDILPPPYVLKLGQFCIEVPPKDDVKPNFWTTPMMFHVCQGAVAKDILVFYFYLVRVMFLFHFGFICV